MFTFLNGRRGRGCRDGGGEGNRPRERDVDSELTTLYSLPL
jgi:hypothetical protein